MDNAVVGTVTSIVEVCREHGLRTPDRQAYTFLGDGEHPTESVTFGDLDRRSLAISRAIRRRAAKGDRAILLYPPGLAFIEAFLGCLYAGVVAVPAYPPRRPVDLSRLAGLADNARPRLVLTAGNRLPRVEARVGRLVEATWLDTERRTEEGGNRRLEGPRNDDLAFLQYTSGSTSTPRGVMVSHANLISNLERIRRTFGQSEDSVVVTWLPPYHDMGLIGSLLSPLYAGGRSILMPPMAFFERPLRWLRAIDRFRATASGGPDFAYDLCVRKIRPEERADLRLDSWEVAFNGAEPIRPETLERFAAAFEPRGFHARALQPCYGLAEATLLVTANARGEPPAVLAVRRPELEEGRVVPGKAEDPACRNLVSSGRAAPGDLVLVVDPETRRPCPPGRTGEIWVSGPGVARGYWDDPVETAACFGATLAESGDGPFLRTGDLGFLDRGELFVTGRLKDLIILRGRNYYPQDLELSAGGSHPALRPGGAAAFAVERDGRERLVLALELTRPRSGDAAAIAGAVRRAVAEEHELRVDELVLLRPGALPKTSSGKLRRRACRARYLAGELTAVFRAGPVADLAARAERPRLDRRALSRLSPAGRTRAVTAFLRSETARLARLPVERVRPEEPFAAAGLDSLMAVEIAHAVEAELGVALSLSELFLCPSLTGLAERVLEGWDARADRPASTLLPEGETEGDFPLSHGQRALWFTHRLAPESTVHVIGGAGRIAAELDLGALRRAARALAEHHPALRTTFPERDAEPVQRVGREAEVDFETANGSGWDPPRCRRWLDDALRSPFDLERGPLLRIGALSLSRREHYVYLAVHHLVADFRSLAVLSRDLGTFYRRETGTGGPGPEGPPVRYSDFTRWQRGRLDGPRGEELAAFWRRRLGAAPALDLPSDRPRPAVPSYRGATLSFDFDDELTLAVKALGEAHGATLFMTLLAAFQALLHRYCAQEVVVVGTPTAGRGRPELEDLVGYLVNPVALVADLSPDPKVGTFLGQVRDTTLAAFEHQECPFIQVVELARPEREASRAPIFQVMLVLYRAGPDEKGLIPFALGRVGGRIELGGLAVESVDLESASSELDLTLTLAELDGRLVGSLAHSTDLFDATSVHRLAKQLRSLLRQFVTSPRDRLSELVPLTLSERHQMLREWNDARRDTTPDRDLGALVEDQVRLRPEAVAVVSAERHASYAEIDRRAERVAGALRSLGLGADSPVGVAMARTPDLVAALLGVWKAGAAYVPMDPAYPDERLALTAADARIQALISEKRLLARLPASPAHVLSMDRLGSRSSTAPGSAAGPFNLSHVIYTSGSTGTPKGVAITRRGVAALLAWARRTFPPSRLTGVVASTSLNFDLSVFELFAPLASGGRVILVEDALALADLPAACPASLLNTVPSVLAELLGLGAVPKAVETIALAGEPLAGLLVEQALRQTRAERIYNLYGPSEDTTYSTVSRVGRGGGEPSIGRPIDGTGGYVMDRRLRPVPVGASGELSLGGLGLARGYLGRPAATAVRFVPDPSGEEPGGRLYRTGDRVRLSARGELTFQGRLDHQVKVRGFRIELGEVEAVLRRHTAVREAAVAVLEESAAKHLVAWFVPLGERAPAPGDLRDFLRGILPPYMVPSVFVPLDALPRLPNGKVDRRSLPAVSSAGRQSMAEAPSSPLEQRVAAIWAEVLGVASVGLDEDFFDLGGHSLRATRLIPRFRRQLGIDLPVRQVFERRTVRSLAEWIEREGRDLAYRELPAVTPVKRDRPLAPSFAQERMWFLHQLDPESPAYNLPGALRLRGPVDVAALSLAFGTVVRRHEALRTRFAIVDAELVQLLDGSSEPPLLLVELERLPAARADDEARRLAAAEARRTFDLSRGPLLRAVLVHRGAEERLLLVNLHHIVADGLSMRILTRELEVLYGASVEGKEPVLQALPIQYADYAVWQRRTSGEEALVAELAYWRRRLHGCKADLKLPADRPRPARRTSRGGRVAFSSSRRSSAALEALSLRTGVTLFMTLEAAFAALLCRLTGSEDVNVATPVAGRVASEVEPLVGLFVNTLVLRTDLSGDPSFRVLLERVRETALEAYAHQRLPFEKLVEELRPERGLERSPLFQVMFVVEDEGFEEVRLPGLAAAPIELDTGTSKFDWTVGLAPAGSALHGSFEYDSDLFDRSTVRRTAAHFRCLLEEVAEHGERRLSAFGLLAAVERRQLLDEWNDTRQESPAYSGAHQLFEARAARASAAIAVVFEDRHLSYGELDLRAGRLARHLASLGVGPEQLVGISMERSLEMIAGILGILKAGAAYVPLDPEYPADYLRSVCEDSRVSVLLTRESVAGRLPATGARLVSVDRDRERINRPGPRPALAAVSPANLIYMIYTSGSTGRPKGVMVEHRGPCNLFAVNQYRSYELHAESRVLQFASMSFDASVTNLLMTLRTGATLYLAGGDARLGGPALVDLLRERQITNASLPPSVLAAMPDADLPALKTILTGGEPCPASVVARWAPGRQFFNSYGPTEATVCSTFVRCGVETSGDPTIGRPVSNTRVRVLDRRAGLVPVGVAGELHVGGAGLARGYWRRPAETADRFMPDPFASAPGERLYRTGDLTRLLAGGEIEFLGRVDHQVKVRGFRVELGEIEAAAERQPGVAEAVATVRGTGAEACLAVFFVADPGHEPDLAVLRSALRRALPPHEVPASLVELDALPRLPNGKVDRAALPEGRRLSEGAAFEPSDTPAELLLAEIWTDLLRVDRVGRHDDFFDLGGHSILAIRLVSRVRESLRVDLSLRTVFEAPTLAEMAAAVARESRPSGRLSIPRRRAGDPSPPSFAQQRLWFLAQMDPETAAYNMPIALRLGGSLEVAVLERSLREVLRRHEALRTTFLTVEGELRQEVAPCPSRFPLVHVRLAGLPRLLAAREAERLLRREAGRGFDLARGPLFTALVVEVSDREHALLLAMHHICTDGWSVAVMSREFAAAYEAFSEARGPRLPELAVQYPDYAAWQRERLGAEALRESLSYWRRQLADAPAALELPFDRPPASARSPRGVRRQVTLPKGLSEELAALGQRAGASLYMTLLAAWQTLLHRYSRQDVVCVGSPVANREPAELEDLIGLFVNTLVLATDLSDPPDFEALLERVKETALQAYAHRELPFDLLVEKLEPKRRPSSTPLFQVMLALQNLAAPTLELPGLTVEPLPLETGAAKFWLTLELAEHPEGLAGSLEYDADRFDGTTIVRMLGHFRRLLEEAVADPGRRLRDLPLLSPAETHALACGWSSAETPAFVLDPFLRLVPAGVRGELYVAGRGALSPSPTQRFVPDPFGSVLGAPGSRLRRTGARARRLADGTLLVEERETTPSSPDAAGPPPKAAAAPRTPAEEMLSQIWCEVLELPSVDVEADFFDLGGHSLLAMRVTSRIRRLFRLDLGVRALFENPTIARLAAALDRGKRGAGPEIPHVERRPREEAPPLSFAQLRLWFLDRMEPVGWAYNVPQAFVVRGRLDLPAMRRSFQELAGRHEVLRTVFAASDPEPVQVIRPAAPVEVPVVDLRGPEEPVRRAEAERLAIEEARTPFDLARGPLLRARLLRLGAEEHVLLLNLHHIASDAWSMGVLMRDVGAFYEAFASRRRASLSELPIQYADYAAWQRSWLSGALLASELAYWKERLRGLSEVLELPVDRQRTERSLDGGIAPVRPSRDLAHGLAELSRSEGATLFMTLLAAFKVLLFRSGGADDFAVGVPVAGRDLVESEELVGLFVNVLALRTRLAGDPPFRELLGRVRETVLEAHAHPHLPFEKLVEELQPRRRLDHPPICQVTFQLQHPPRLAASWAALEVRPWNVGLPFAAKLDLSLTLAESDAGLEGVLGFNASLFDRSTISRFTAHYDGILRDAVRHPDRRLSELSFLAPAERQQVLVEWNDTAPGPAVSREPLLHELFESQADRRPDSVALVFGTAQLTFGGLERRANRLARYLRRRRAGGETTVALCARRSLEAVTAILGILKSGGVYLALDPDHPRRRLDLLLEESGSEVLVTRRDWLPAPPEAAAAPVFLDSESAAIRSESGERLRSTATPENLAWVFFTSGSTGTPKGVAVAHRGAVNYLTRYFGARWRWDDSATVLQLAGLAFDASMRDLVGSLTVGARVALCDETERKDPRAILAAIRRHRVTCVLSTVPTFLSAVLDAARPEDGAAPLDLLLVSGEPFPMPLYRRAREVFGEEVEVVNQYGPTETTVTTTCQLLAADDPRRGVARLGRPIPGTRLHVLGRDLAVLPAGARGEIHLGGSGLARGYLSRPARTAAVFVPDPFGCEPGGRLYRTGDLARRGTDGNTEFQGRHDHQVKLRGLRIELGEIESVLQRHPAVRQTAVAARPSGPGAPDSPPDQLVAYVVAAKGRPASGELTAFLGAELPAHLVPSAFVWLEALPSLGSGKVDRRALPPPPRTPGTAGSPAPRDRTELEMARIWEELLGVSPVGARDDFFRLGGHSLLAVRLLDRVEKRFGVEISLATLFRRSTLEALSARVREGPAARTEPLLVPLKPGGSRPPFIWVHPVGGNVLCYAELARHLEADQPFYAFRSPGLAERETRLTSVEAMAARYVEEIRAARAARPYRLGGWSMGGIVAFEMARQLREAGEEVSLLALLDTRAPSSQTEPEDPLDTLAAFAGDLGFRSEELEAMAGVAAALNPDEALDLLLERTRSSGLLPPRIGDERMRRLFEVFRSNRRARLDYRPRPYGGRVVLFRASESRDSVGDWSPWMRGDVRETSIPGDHYSVLRPPGVSILARQLEACLTAAVVP